MHLYELVHYGENAAGPRQSETVGPCTESAAKSRAGRLAKRIDGPVDIASAAPNMPWEARYITTASPSPFHETGYRFERLD